MNQEKFENVGRLMMIVFFGVIILLFISFVGSTVYYNFQDNELNNLKKQELDLKIKVQDKQFEKLVQELNQKNQ